MQVQNEVNWLTKIRHQNIISLLGYCIHAETRFLVYEMMQNGSLEKQLHGMSLFSILNYKVEWDHWNSEDTKLMLFS